MNDKLEPLPIVDKVLKDFHGRIVNSVKLPKFTFGKELQLHVMEIRPNTPFESPIEFEETMQDAVLTVQDFLHRKYQANLLGTGMHPLLRLEETNIWPHRHRQIYQAYSKIFNLKRHGWLNIQSFQLNLPYSSERKGVLLHNILTYICAYLPAFAASSPIYEGRLGENVDNRLHFYMKNQKEIPSVTGDIIPEYVSSLGQYREEIINKYSQELAAAGANSLILNKEWVNSRGIIFRFDRRALEIRVMDEQECVKSDVALSCFIRALTRGLIGQEFHLPTHQVLVENFGETVRNGLDGTVHYPQVQIAREACKDLIRVAWENATGEEKKYIQILQKRVKVGNLSERIRQKVQNKSQKTDLSEAIVNIYSKLIGNLMDNEPYF
ncbi:MAG TPA: glutamate-cysteine ligase family protein [Candidatus Acidoferrum sp.]|nr:glutamate-cysteine ligase family protein [Candidatus Acidoferrum sp.]